MLELSAPWWPEPATEPAEKLETGRRSHLKNKHLSPQQGHRIKVPVADVGRLVVWKPGGSRWGGRPRGRRGRRRDVFSDRRRCRSGVGQGGWDDGRGRSPGVGLRGRLASVRRQGRLRLRMTGRGGVLRGGDRGRRRVLMDRRSGGWGT